MADLINDRTAEKIKHGLEWVAFECDHQLCDDCKFAQDCHTLRRYEIAKDALDLIKHLEAERDAALAKVTRWIGVEEQPNPTEDGEYWCHGYWLMSGREQTEVAEYLGEWKIANNFILTHWMPLHKPPKGDA